MSSFFYEYFPKLAEKDFTQRTHRYKAQKGNLRLRFTKGIRGLPEILALASR